MAQEIRLRDDADDAACAVSRRQGCFHIVLAHGAPGNIERRAEFHAEHVLDMMSAQVTTPKRRRW
jgi:hypothetical protein